MISSEDKNLFIPVKSDCGLLGSKSDRLVFAKYEKRNRSRDVRRSGGSNGGFTLENNNTVGQVGCHDEIVLNDKRRLLGVEDESFHDFGGNDTLFGVQEAMDTHHTG